MKTIDQIKVEGYEALSEKLGIVDTERFISSIISEPFDYTEWQRGLFKSKTAEEISKEAMEYIHNIESGKNL